MNTIPIVEPTLIVDEVKVKKNIEMMVEKAASNNVEFRPHFKTHQSILIAEWFRSLGVTGITVSSLKMATYFAKNQWKDITVAFPINTLDTKRIKELSNSITLNVLVNTKETIQDLDHLTENILGVYIELDPGYGRSGLDMGSIDYISECLLKINESSQLAFKGFYAHAGHTYKSTSKQEILDKVTPILNELRELTTHIKAPICFGDTPSCSILEDFGPITQISPGNFCFYDYTQYTIGSCNIEQIGIAMKCPVVAKYKERNELLIHGGAVHFSKDYLQDHENNFCYGVLVESEGMTWNQPIANSILRSISQEHGIVTCDNKTINHYNVGDIVTILPIHSCLTADLMGTYYTTKGIELDHMNKKIYS